MNNELERFVGNNRDAFDDKEPNPAILQRLQTQMGETNKKKGVLVSFRMIRWAAACLVVLAGIGIFYIGRDNRKTVNIPAAEQLASQPVKDTPLTQQPAQNETAALVPADENNTLVKQATAKDDRYEQQLMARKLALFAGLNDMASPGSRVTAATEINKLKNADKDIVDALVQSMNSDPNTNVRLAALDALTHFRRESYVKQQMIKSLKKQNDPMVQIQLIQTLTRMREKSILTQLEKMVKDDNTMEAVKDNAYSGILTLKS